MPILPEMNVVIQPRVGQQATMVDGLSIQANANQQAHAAYSMPDEMHLDEVIVMWTDFESGDRGWLAMCHPLGMGNPAVDPAGDQLDVGAMAPYFDPANGAQHVEFYNAAGDTLLEVVGITSLAGSVVTLAKVPEGTYTTANHIKSRFQSFNPVRGSHGMGGGFYLLGAGQLHLGAAYEMTSPIPSGMMLCVGLEVGSGGTTRHFGVNFVFREKEAA